MNRDHKPDCPPTYKPACCKRGGGCCSKKSCGDCTCDVIAAQVSRLYSETASSLSDLGIEFLRGIENATEGSLKVTELTKAFAYASQIITTNSAIALVTMTDPCLGKDKINIDFETVCDIQCKVLNNELVEQIFK